MDTPPSLLTAGLAILSALLYLIAVWRQALSLGAGEEGQRQHIALVGAAALIAHALAAYLPAQAGESSLGFYRVASLMFLSMVDLKMSWQLSHLRPFSVKWKYHPRR